MRPGITVENETHEVLFVRYRDGGDQEAFSQLYDAFERRLFAIGVRFFRSRYGRYGARALASDAMQETWTRIVAWRHQWSASPGSFGGWITKIHYHCLLDMAQRAPVDHGPPCEELAPSVHPDRRILARQALEALADTLSEEDAELLAVYYLTGNRNLVAASLRISQLALRKRVARIKESLITEPRFRELFAEFSSDVCV